MTPSPKRRGRGAPSLASWLEGKRRRWGCETVRERVGKEQELALRAMKDEDLARLPSENKRDGSPVAGTRIFSARCTMGVGDSMGDSIAASKSSTCASTFLPLTALPSLRTHPFFSLPSLDEMSEARFEADPAIEALLLDADLVWEEPEVDAGPRRDPPREKSLRALRRKPVRRWPSELSVEGEVGGCE